MQVSAIDRDAGDNGRLTYAIRDFGGSGDRFMVKDTTGEIYVKQEFEASDENRQFVLTLRACDNGKTHRYTKVVQQTSLVHLFAGYIPLCSEAQVTVSVKNRNTPIFAQQFHAVRVREDVEVGASVLVIEADSPTGKKIIYSISDGNVFNEFDVIFDLGESRTLVVLLDVDRCRSNE